MLCHPGCCALIISLSPLMLVSVVFKVTVVQLEGVLVGVVAYLI